MGKSRKSQLRQLGISMSLVIEWERDVKKRVETALKIADSDSKYYLTNIDACLEDLETDLVAVVNAVNLYVGVEATQLYGIGEITND